MSSRGGDGEDFTVDAAKTKVTPPKLEEAETRTEDKLLPANTLPPSQANPSQITNIKASPPTL